MREDFGSHTEHAAALYEQRRGQADDPDPRPTMGELQADDCYCLDELWERVTIDTAAGADLVWACEGCGQIQGPAYPGGAS